MDERYRQAKKRHDARLQEASIAQLESLEDYLWLPDLEYQKKYRRTKPVSLDLGGLSLPCNARGIPDPAFNVPRWCS